MSWRELSAAALLLAAGSASFAAAQARQPAFATDVAPILYKHCAACHHAGGQGPFPLITYADARRRARQIADVTGRRFMPPWLPARGHVRFAGERRLTDAEIATLAAWARAGAPEGDPRAAPALPVFTDGWQLGTPDLVLTLTEDVEVPAEGEDVFWNVVFQTGLTTTRAVRALEIRPGNPRIVHHCNVLLDGSGAARARDAEAPGPGFAGMDLELASARFEPDSHFLFWKPGSPSRAEPDDMAWLLHPSTDLVLNMHLQPSGRVERLRPQIGLYFTDKAPAKFPMLVQLERDGDLRIPAGAARFSVTDELELPADVHLLGVYPHAHYLGKRLEAWAALPGGERRVIIRIDDWDMNWQGVYELAEPLPLPRGAVLGMRWEYDNTAANIRNPNDPPRLVTAGNRASDEMAHLWLQLLPATAGDRLVLQQALMRTRLRKYPGDFVALANLGAVLHTLGRVDEAIAYLRQAVDTRPAHPDARNALGAALLEAGRVGEAAAEFRRTLQISPGHADAAANLAQALLRQGSAAEAVGLLQPLALERPDDVGVLVLYGAALATTGRLQDADGVFETVLRLRPDDFTAHYNRGLIAARRGDLTAAARHLEAAVRLDPSSEDARSALGEVRAAQAAR